MASRLSALSLSHLGNGEDVENRETFDTLRVIERQAIRDTAAAIMSPTEKRENPSRSITATMSFATARFA